MIIILDYDMGNILSVKNMLHSIGYDDVLISNDHSEIIKADGLILPGVGAFDYGMQNLSKFGLINLIKEIAINDQKPILGICLGMQLLGIDSEEGEKKGLGLIPFHTKRFRPSEEYKVPHMGWDEVEITKRNLPILKHVISYPPRYYFVHSYYAVCDDENDILMKCSYENDFAAAVSKENIYGVQFHPEKSHKFGKEIMKGFVDLVK